jgi:hypothetical protein
MSLTSLLKNKEIYSKFKETFPKPRFSSSRKLLVHPLTKNWVNVGHAFDYLLRFHLNQKFPKVTKDNKNWIAHHGLEIIENWNGTPHIYKAAKNIVKNAEIQHKQFLKTGQLDDNLIRSCILLSKIDAIYRTGGSYYPDSLKDFLHVDNLDIQDLKNLIAIVPFEEFRPQIGISLNPTFGLGSVCAGGADADLIIDNCIIDIKVTKDVQQVRNPYIFLKYWFQCLGYYTLYRIDTQEDLSSNISYPGFPEIKIDQIGFYFARYGYLCKYRIDQIIDEKKFDDFMSWFFDITMES